MTTQTTGKNPKCPHCGSRWATAPDAMRKAQAAMATFTPAIDAVLWIALNWNDHNFSSDVIREKARQAATALGVPEWDNGLCPSQERQRIFDLWNEAMAALKIGAGGTAPEGHNERANPAGAASSRQSGEPKANEG